MSRAGPPLRPEGTAQAARVAYEAYRDALALSFPLPWERLPAATQQAWAAVVRVLRTGGPAGAGCHH